MIITDITACNVPSPNIWNSWKQSHHGLDDFLRDLLWQMSQIQLKLASMANNPHLLCTCWDQIMQFDCIIIQRAESECCHSEELLQWEDWALIIHKPRGEDAQSLIYFLHWLISCEPKCLIYLDACYPNFCGKTLSTLWFYVSGHIKYNQVFIHLNLIWSVKK